MAEKTIKIDEGVHERLEQKKGDLGVDTFNQVLERMLGVTPEASVDALGAYLSDGARTIAQEMFDTISSIGQLEPRVAKSGYGQILEFVSEESGLVIVDLEFSESTVWARYRDPADELRPCGVVSETGNEVELGRGSKPNDSTDKSELLENLEKKVEGAWRRWGAE